MTTTEVQPRESMGPLRAIPNPEQYKLCRSYKCPECQAGRGEDCISWATNKYINRPHTGRLRKVPLDKWPKSAVEARNAAILARAARKAVRAQEDAQEAVEDAFLIQWDFILTGEEVEVLRGVLEKLITRPRG